MPYTAKVYHAVKPVSNRVAPKTYGAERPKPSGSGRDSFVWKHWDNNKPPGFRPTETPWARNSTAPWANDRMAKRPPKKRLNYNAKSAEAKRQRQKFLIQQQYMKILKRPLVQYLEAYDVSAQRLQADEIQLRGFEKRSMNKLIIND